MLLKRTVNNFLYVKNDFNIQQVAYYRTRYQPGARNFQVDFDLPPDVNPPPGTKRFVYNRNPRNLERLGIAYRNEGWSIDKVGRTFYHKLIILSGYKEIKVSCLHNSGRIAISACTNEWAIRKYLLNAGDRSACINLGRIFAHRCLQSGLTEMINTYKSTDGKLSLLLKEIQDGGISLCEPERQVLRNVVTKVQPPRPWDVTFE